MREIFKKIVVKLKEEKGAHMTVMNMGIVIFILFVVSIISTMVMIFSLAIQSRNQVQEATVGVIQNNYANVYHTSRESYSGGYLPNNIAFSESIIINEESIYNVLVGNMAFEKVNDTTLEKVDKNGNILYKIKGIQLDIRNESIGSGTQNFVATTTYTFIYPLKLLWYEKDFEVELIVKAKHSGKF